MDLALNNQPWFICYKTKPNQTKQNKTNSGGNVFLWKMPV